MASTNENVTALHPITDVALSLLQPGETEKYALSEENAVTLAGVFQQYLATAEARAAAAALVGVAYVLDTNHRCPVAARVMLSVAGLATPVLEMQNAAVTQDTASARTRLAQFSGARPARTAAAAPVSQAVRSPAPKPPVKEAAKVTSKVAVKPAVKPVVKTGKSSARNPTLAKTKPVR
jgi:hypothetical protein